MWDSRQYVPCLREFFYFTTERTDFYNKIKKKYTGAEVMTIKEIAQLAQVSSAAVSRYMNGGYVSEEKKKNGFGQ